jgi:hypothetical protein
MDRDLPSLDEARARRELLPKLAEWIDFDDAFGGERELWLDVEDAEEVMPVVEQVLADLGLLDAATVTTE